MRETLIEPKIRDILSSIEWDDNTARLTCGVLDRKDYLKVNSALETAGAKWNKKAKAHLAEADCKERLDYMVETGHYVSTGDLAQFYGIFYTPDELGDTVCSLAGISNMDRILEPSAGEGSLIKAALRTGRTKREYITAVEIRDVKIPELKELAGTVIEADFLKLEPTAIYDTIILNPPYGRQADIDHVLHAWKFLNDDYTGGTLVAIMSSGWTFRQNEKSRKFREFVAEHGRYIENPPGSFKEAGTGVNTVIVVLERD